MCCTICLDFVPFQLFSASRVSLSMRRRLLSGSFFWENKDSHGTGAILFAMLSVIQCSLQNSPGAHWKVPIKTLCSTPLTSSVHRSQVQPVSCEANFRVQLNRPCKTDVRRRKVLILLVEKQTLRAARNHGETLRARQKASQHSQGTAICLGCIN